MDQLQLLFPPAAQAGDICFPSDSKLIQAQLKYFHLGTRHLQSSDLYMGYTLQFFLLFSNWSSWNPVSFFLPASLCVLLIQLFTLCLLNAFWIFWRSCRFVLWHSNLLRACYSHLVCLLLCFQDPIRRLNPFLRKIDFV